MSRNAITLNLVAGGDILPQSFVKLDKSAPETALQAVSGDTPIGISGNWTRYAGGTPADDGLEANNTEFPTVFGVGCVVPLVCGNTGTWTAGVFLKPDASGYGTPTTSTNDKPGALSLTAASPGEVGRVVVVGPGGQGVARIANYVTTAINTTLTAANSGQTIIVTAADKSVTLPTGAVGLTYRVVPMGNATATGATGTTIKIGGSDTIKGGGYTAAVGKGLINTIGNAVAGDTVSLTCIAANSWYVTHKSGVWTSQS